MWKSRVVPVMFVCAFFMRWSTSSSGRPAYGGPAQRMCPPQSTANCNHLWGRGGVAGCPQSPSTCGRIVGARSSDKNTQNKKSCPPPFSASSHGRPADLFLEGITALRPQCPVCVEQAARARRGRARPDPTPHPHSKVSLALGPKPTLSLPLSLTLTLTST